MSWGAGPAGQGGAGLGQGPRTLKGPCSGTRASALPLSAWLRGGDPGGLSGEEEQAVAGSTGGGRRVLWAARRGPQAPPGDVRARLRGRTGPQGTTEGPELARGESRGTPGDTEAGGSGEFKWSLWGMRRVPKTHESPLLDARGPSQGGASGCPFGGDFREPLRMDGRRKQDLKG